MALSKFSVILAMCLFVIVVVSSCTGANKAPAPLLTPTAATPTMAAVAPTTTPEARPTPAQTVTQPRATPTAVTATPPPAKTQPIATPASALPTTPAPTPNPTPALTQSTLPAQSQAGAAGTEDGDDDVLDLGRFLSEAPPPSTGQDSSGLDDAARAPGARRTPAPVSQFSPTSATPGGRVTLSGQAKPNTFISAYFYCNVGCGETHVGVARVAANGSYSFSFLVPSVARPGGAYLFAGCDTCGNGWKRFGGLNIVQSAASQNKQSIIEKSYQRAFGRNPTADELKFWMGVPDSDPRVSSINALVTSHLQYLKQNAETTFGADVVRRAFKEATGQEAKSAPNYDGTLKELKANAPAYKDLVWHIRVDVAFRTAHGRAPTDAELKLWKSSFGIISDEEDAILKAWTINSVVGSFRKNLQAKANTPLAKEVVALAFKNARGRDPDANEVSTWVGELAKQGLIYPDLVLKIGEVARITFTSADAVIKGINDGKLSESVYMDIVKRGGVLPSIQWTIAQRFIWRYDPPSPAISLVNTFTRNYFANAKYDIDALPDVILLGLSQGKLPALSARGYSVDNMGGEIIPQPPLPASVNYSSPQSVSQAIKEHRIQPTDFKDIMVKGQIPKDVIAYIALNNEVFLANVTPMLPADVYLTQVTPLIRPDQLNNATPLWVRLDLIGNTGATLTGNAPLVADNSIGLVPNISLTVLEPLTLPGGNLFTMPIGNNYSVASLGSGKVSNKLKRLPPNYFR